MAKPELDNSRSSDGEPQLIDRYIEPMSLRWIFPSVLLFCVALALPGLEFANSDGGVVTFNGAELLARGWMGYFDAQFAWFANLPLAVGWLCLIWWRPRAALICGLIALVVSLHVHRGFSIPRISDVLSYQRPLAGYYCWTGSVLLLVVGAIIGVRREPTAFSSFHSIMTATEHV